MCKIMNRKVVLLGLLACAGFGWLGYRLMVATLNGAAVTATQSCLSSVAAAIEKTGGSDFVEANRGPEWQVVTQPQVKQFLQKVGSALDCRGSSDGEVCDAWGRPLVIAWKRAEDGVWVNVSSVGRDGLPVTNDDVSVVVLLRGH
jgi:hypothetical protein